MKTIKEAYLIWLDEPTSEEQESFGIDMAKEQCFEGETDDIAQGFFGGRQSALDEIKKELSEIIKENCDYGVKVDMIFDFLGIEDE